jgi:hypothetical protein
MALLVERGVDLQATTQVLFAVYWLIASEWYR